MTPRTVMVALQADMTVGRPTNCATASRFRACRCTAATRTTCSASCCTRTSCGAPAGPDDQPVSTLRRDLLSVPATSPLTGLMDALLKRRQHIAVVVGEFGETRGLVTLEDLVETCSAKRSWTRATASPTCRSWRASFGNGVAPNCLHLAAPTRK
jgi:CBS domain containing-hemolysin-like protein